MSTPPVPPPGSNDPRSGSSDSGSPNTNGDAGNQPPRFGENAPQYGQNAPQYGQNAPQQGQGQPQYGQNAPQYGQNAPQQGQQYGQGYGQQFGQNPPGGQQFGQSPYGQSPYPSEQPQPAGSNGVPQLVNISFWLLLAAAAIFVISMLTGLGQLNDPVFRQTFEDQMESSGATGVTYDDVQGFIGGTLVVFAILGAGLYFLVAFFVRKGKNWARILGTVFAGLSVFGLFGIPTIGTLGTVLGIAAIVLLYLPASAPYFRKQQPFANPYGGGFGSPYGR
ncbi:conserved hypothetical protein [Pseudarthrobacter chlorophenolicus A6]|uniref:DUF4064 domain-containing protein n=1 Tax=Pseudarthrobacter chlorophenolicus (strain ATCC 700700 / DSM 12829 / CIP 107037 / JCM 12360 / KCTC 9906 / NCIMB 13794 / A6) TaxID=452863 RepID=B8HF88_PSECP|nr:hypothetical protein [Pseudarthrobacter chlorophenolicus]ACL41056.1 conserved hypothetical protein [Pseudarthrobacter chlorophenolicus A6]SDQ70609.1 hypothetical protein SAMN04489738_2385 [Pseudarthrobacter chlorophenolicus]